MFHLKVFQEDKAIQVRDYSTAHECTRNLWVAWNYYHTQGIALKIQMLDSRGLLIKELNSAEELTP
jgi:hypothetical protein